MTPAALAVDTWLEPLDRVRKALFVRALGIAPFRAILVEKRRRIPALLVVHGSAALVLSVFVPTALLVLGPILLGVPHVIADLRYLVLRPRLKRSARACLLLGSAALLGLGAAELLGIRGLVRWELGFSALWITVASLIAAPRFRDARLLVVALLAGAFAAVGLHAPSALRLAMAHSHNVVALCLWAFVFCSSRVRALWVTAAILGAAALLATTPLAWWGLEHGVVRSFGLHAFAAADQLAPFARRTEVAVGVVASFAFLQSVHYAVWLHAIPQEAVLGEGTRGFRRTFRTLLGELGSVALMVSLVVVVAVPLRGLSKPLATQTAYLTLSVFHGYLELAALAVFWFLPRAAIDGDRGRAQP
jgi:hypothetical protein